MHEQSPAVVELQTSPKMVQSDALLLSQSHSPFALQIPKLQSLAPLHSQRCEVVLQLNPFEQPDMTQPQPTPAKQVDHSSEAGQAGPVEFVSPTQVQSPPLGAEHVSSASQVVPESPQRQPVPGKHWAFGPESGQACAPPAAIVALHWHWFVAEQTSSAPQTPPPLAPLQSHTPEEQIGMPPVP